MDITANVLRVSRALLDVADHRRYGYELMRETRLHTASMYKLLHRLEDEGWLTSYLEPGDPKFLGRKRRRYYELTELGRERAQAEVRNWSDVLRMGHQSGNTAA